MGRTEGKKRGHRETQRGRESHIGWSPDLGSEPGNLEGGEGKEDKGWEEERMKTML